MRAYAYTAYTAEGRRQNGTIIAETEQHAARLLQDKGHFPSELEARAQAAPRMGLRLRAGLSADLRAVFTRQMAVLLSAGLTAEASLEAVRASDGSSPLGGFAARVKAAVMDGAALSDALDAAQGGYPPYYTAAIRAGEVSGDLDAVFGELADHLEAVGTDKAQIGTALIYPAFVAAVSLLVCGVLMTTVAPEIVAMFEMSGQPLPRITEVVLAISGWIERNWMALAVTVLALILLALIALRLPGVRAARDRVLMRLPLAGRLIRLAAAAQYLRTLALVIASRQPVPDAAQSAAAVLTRPKFRDEAATVSEAIRRGESLSGALAGLSIIPPVALQLVSAGETSARLARMTERAAVLTENTLATDRKRIAALLEPLLMLLVGGFVLVIVLAVLLPIFDLQATIG